MFNYADVRDSLQSGDFIAQTHLDWKTVNDFQIQGVRFMTQSEYSHVGMIWKVTDRIFLIEAVVPCVRLIPLSMVGDFFHVPMKKELSYKALEFALDQIGEPYSKWMAIKAFFNKVTNKDTHRWQCAKLVCDILRANGTDYGLAYRPDTLVQAALEDGKDIRYIKNKRE
jgi:uncharacterized protein YycO